MKTDVQSHIVLTMKSRAPWLIFLIGIVLSVTLFALAVRHLISSSRVFWLVPKDGAAWLRLDARFDLVAKLHTSERVEFRTTLQIPSGWSRGTLELTALRRGEVSIDDRNIFDTGPDLNRWKSIYTIELPRNLTAGSHLLRVRASNLNGPALIRINCKELPITAWEASADGTHWSPAAAASQPFEPDLQYEFPSAIAAFSQCWPLLLGLTAVGSLIFWRLPLQLPARWGRRGRWVILTLLLLMAARARTMLPMIAGYDVTSHIQYIQYVAEHHRLPKADQGWEFFQAPLYYVISGAFYALLQRMGITGLNQLMWLRVIPLASGIGMVEIVYRTAKTLFPSRGDLQLIATAIGGFVPMNLYMSQLISNEPLAGVIAAAGVLMMIQFLVKPQSCTLAKLAMLGVITGLAWLTKVTLLLWLLPIEISVLIAMRRDHRLWRKTAGSLTVVPLIAILISGGYFIHNHRTEGKWIITNTTGQWWQDPGYRTPEMFFSFGHVLSGAAFTTSRSVWDSLYGTLWGDGMLSGLVPVAPIAKTPDGAWSGMESIKEYLPYNYWLMACGLWLGLLPMALIFTGITAIFTKRRDTAAGNNRAPLVIAVLSIGIFILAILYQYLVIPVYGWGKASYMLSATPCLAILAATGFDLLGKTRLGRSAMGGVIFTWAMTAYLTYWIV